MNVVAENREAHVRYEIIETLEAGIVLLGQEVKSVKAGRASLRGAFVTMRGDEAFLTNAAIPPWQPQNTPQDYDPNHPRKLLLHRAEIKTLIGRLSQKGLTAIPITLYTKQGRVKVAIGIARYKNVHDKREVIKKREAKREIERTFKSANR